MATPAAAGRAGAPGRERIAELQRARILAAIVELVSERGVAAITVAHITARSRVSRRTFYELFDDRDDCLAAAFELALQDVAAVVVPAYESVDRGIGAKRSDGAGAGGRRVQASESWEARMRAGLSALLEFLDAEPARSRLLVVDALAANDRVLERRAHAVEVLTDAVHRGGERSGMRRRPARIVAEGVVGAVLSVIHARMRQRDRGSLAELLGPLVGMVILPYRGAVAAEREQRRPTPSATERPSRPMSAPYDPLCNLDMRLTYRTLRVLHAIAELGGTQAAPSSREVADAAGVSDQGQISKLLWRLEHLGLIVNGVESPGRGSPNAWALTAKGRGIEHAVQVQGK